MPDPTGDRRSGAQRVGEVDRRDAAAAAGGALGCGVLLAVAAGAAWIFVPAFRASIGAHPWLAAAVAIVVLLAISIPSLWHSITRWSPQRKILLYTSLALTPAVLVYLLEEVGIRLLFLLIVCLFPGLLFYLFVSARRYSLLNEHLTHLHQLGLLEARGDEKPEDTTRRISSYLQEFQAIYGNLPKGWVTRFMSGETRAFSQEDQEPEAGEMTAFASLISTDTMLPVMLTTTLVVVGWLWTLPPWHIEETLKSWESLGTHAVLIQEPEGAEAAAAGALKAEPEPAGDAEESGQAPEATPEPAATETPEPGAQEEGEEEETAAGEEPDASASVRPAGDALYLLALAAPRQGEAPEEAEEPATGKAWYKPWTWFRSDKEERPAAAPAGEVVETGTPAEEAAAPAATPDEMYRRYQAALLPVMTPMTFAFLGAYFFSLQLLFRRFVRRDLGASAYVSFSVRIVLAWVATWVVVHAFGGFDPREPDAALLLVGFTVGVFPSVVWHVLQVSTRAVLGKMFDKFRVQLPISRLDGLNIWHQTRLEEEDIENIPCMANANIVELLLRTRIPANRILDWVDQAILYTHLGPEARDATDPPSQSLRHHGILNATSLLRTHREATARNDVSELEAILPGSTGRSRIRSLVDAVEINPNLDLIEHWREACRRAP